MSVSTIRRQSWQSALLVILILHVLCSVCSHAAAPFPEFIDPNPNSGNQFGATVVVLSTGNVVITSPFDNAGGSSAGAVYLFNGATGALISTLTGSQIGDQIGSGGVIALSNGNYVVSSPSWNNGTVVDAGAVTWGSGVSGRNGTVNSGNSLVGTQANDQVGYYGVTALSNGNYVVASRYWDNASAVNAGAVTWGNGTTGVSGVVSSSNSLVGTMSYDQVGYGSVNALSNGNYVVTSPNWDNTGKVNVGAVTWGSGTSGVSGIVNSNNSLVGTQANDQVGYDGVTALSNGNYVVRSGYWDNAGAVDAGAVTWGSGTTGVSGGVSSSNSLVGTTASDGVGSNDVIFASNGYSCVTALSSGNYVVASPNWDNASAVNAGAVTWGNGTSGVSGAVSSNNSLVGTWSNSYVSSGGVKVLSNGNYVVASSDCNIAGLARAGAVTWGSGTAGVSGVISSSNSLVGTALLDRVGETSVTALSNGNYVVASLYWNNAVGAVTWGNGSSGTSGAVTSSNSLVGTRMGDWVGKDGVTALSNGNYVVSSSTWSNTGADSVGAVTWGNGSSGVSGVVTSSNSLVGSTASDLVGKGGVIALKNGNFVVISPYWNNAGVTAIGAVTWGSGTSGVSGVVSSSNSLVGTNTDDKVGYGSVIALSNGNYVVLSSTWDNTSAADAGAVTWGSGSNGVNGIVSSSNSLVGTQASDYVGSGSVTALSNGNYVVRSPRWNNAGVVDAGAVTWGSGSSGVNGAVTSGNSLVGSTDNDQVGYNYDYNYNSDFNSVMALSNGSYVVRSRYWDNAGLFDAGAVTWGSGSGGVSGVITSGNSLIGLTSGAALQPVLLDNLNSTYIGSFPNESSGKVRLGNQANGLAPNAVDIAVEQASPLTDGVGSVSYGSLQVGSSVSFTFSITNSGSATLKNLVVSKNGTNASDFTVSALSGTSIPVGIGVVTFTVTFAPSSGGAKSAALHIASNVSGAKNPFDINLTGIGQLSSDANLSSLSLSGVTLTPTFATDTISYTASVPNAITTLTVSPVKVEPLASVQVRVNGGNYVLPSNPLGLNVGINSVEVRVIAQDGITTKTYSIAVTRSEGPEIVIRGNGLEIADGDSTPSATDDTYFGAMVGASGMITRTFTIANEGSLALNLNGAPLVSISGAHAADFHVSLMPGSAIAASSSTTFQVTFDPSVGGLRTAVVSIDSDDADETPYSFSVSGSGRLASQAAQTLVFTPPAKLYLAESPFTLSSSSSSGLPVVYTVISGPASVSGNVLTLTGAGVVKVRASQSGNADFLAATPVERTITVAANPTTLTLTNLSQTYTGTPRPITVLGATGAVEVTYQVGFYTVPTPPTNAGSYPVKAVAGAVTKTGTLIITKAPLFVQPDDQRKFAGQVNPVLGFGYSGFLGSDNAANSVSKAPVIATTATATSAGGLYPITASGGTSANYLFVYLKGTMKVETFAASYEALLVDAGRPAAKLELTVVASSKTFTGKLTTPTETAAVALNGTLGAPSINETVTGTATKKVGLNTYLVNVTLPLSGDFTAEAKLNGTSLGTASNGEKLLTLATGQTLSYIGTHSALLAPATAGAGVPAGAGWAVATIDAKGLLKLTGKLADGTGLTASLAADVSSHPGYRLFVQPYTPARTGAFIAGAFTLKPHPDVAGRRYVAFEDVADLTWVKAPRSLDTSYRAGFGPVDTRFTLDPWLPPAAAKGLVPAITLTQRLGLTANQFTAQHSAISSASFIDLPTTLGLNATTNVVSVSVPLANATKWKVTLTPATGAFVGSFELNDNGKKRPVPFTGMMRQPPSTDTSRLIGDGNFQLPSLSPAPNNEVLSGEVGFEK